MKSLRKFLFVACIGSSFGIAAADPLEQQLSLTAASGTAWNIDWAGVAGRTYFMQWSLDLEAWSYSPMMAFGAGSGSYGTDALGAEKYFVRLRYLDASWISNLQQARAADFDADGIPSYFEVENLFSDPLDGESSGGNSDVDGLADGWELFYFGNLTTANPITSSQPDGLTNQEKSELGLNPNIDYSDPNATAPSKFIYDLTGRLTSVTAPLAAANYTPDEEGNLLDAQ